MSESKTIHYHCDYCGGWTESSNYHPDNEIVEAYPIVIEQKFVDCPGSQRRVICYACLFRALDTVLGPPVAARVDGGGKA
jgi:hypothetical protein